MAAASRGGQAARGLDPGARLLFSRVYDGKSDPVAGAMAVSRLRRRGGCGAGEASRLAISRNSARAWPMTAAVASNDLFGWAADGTVASGSSLPGRLLGLRCSASRTARAPDRG